MADNYLQYSTQYDFPREVSEEEKNKLFKKIPLSCAEIIGNRLLLRFQSQARLALSSRRDSEIRDDATL